MAEPGNSEPGHGEEEVVIIGGGFTGMNAARLLAQMGVPCSIYNSGFGASNLWLGTVDVLNYPGDNLLLELAKFQVSLPAHPYSNLSMELMQQALKEFYDNFPSLFSFRDEGEICNGHVLSSLGNTKLTTGVWDSIFRNFESLGEESICVLVEFTEFSNSAMHLIAKGLGEKFPGIFPVLEISLRELFYQMNSDLIQKIKDGEISGKMAATFFDSKAIHMSPLASLIKAQLAEQYPPLGGAKIQYYLFPPVLGIDNSPTVITHLSSHLGADCFEVVSLTPSIIAERFIHQFKRKLEVLAVPYQEGFTLVDLTRNNGGWSLALKSRSGETQTKEAKVVIFAVGSIFAQGVFTEPIELGNIFHRLGIEFPDSINKNYELGSAGANSNLFVAGAGNFLFSTDLNEDDEARDGTGLGLAIATSYKIASLVKGRARPNQN